MKYVALIIIGLFVNSCVQQSQPKTITVTVDMRQESNVDKVGIRGTSPLSWDETTYLSDLNNDRIYEQTFDIYTTTSQVAFKFVNQNNNYELKDQPDRVLTLENKPEVITYQAVFNQIEPLKITRK